MSIVKTYYEKASLPRESRNASDLRNSLRAYTARRLLHVADVCGAVEDVEYLTKSLITWMRNDYENAMTGAQKDSAGMCATELLMIVDKFTVSDDDDKNEEAED